MPLRRGWLAWTLATATVLLAAADIVTTEILIRMGGEEGQPIIAWLMSHLGIWWVVPKFFANVAITAFLIVLWQHRVVKIAMVAYVVIYAATIVYHCILMVKWHATIG